MNTPRVHRSSASPALLSWVMAFVLIAGLGAHIIPWMSQSTTRQSLLTQQELLSQVLIYDRLVASYDEAIRAIILAPERKELRERKVGVEHALKRQLGSLVEAAPSASDIPSLIIGLADHLSSKVIPQSKQVELFAKAPGDWALMRFKLEYAEARKAHLARLDEIADRSRRLVDAQIQAGERGVFISAGVFLIGWGLGLGGISMLLRPQPGPEESACPKAEELPDATLHPPAPHAPRGDPRMTTRPAESQQPNPLLDSRLAHPPTEAPKEFPANLTSPPLDGLPIIAPPQVPVALDTASAPSDPENHPEVRPATYSVPSPIVASPEEVGGDDAAGPAASPAAELDVETQPGLPAPDAVDAGADAEEEVRVAGAIDGPAEGKAEALQAESACEAQPLVEVSEAAPEALHASSQAGPEPGSTGSDDPVPREGEGGGPSPESGSEQAVTGARGARPAEKPTLVPVEVRNDKALASTEPPRTLTTSDLVKRDAEGGPLDLSF